MFSFDAPDKDEKEVQKQINRTVSVAKKCLANPDFEEYRKQLEVAKEKILRQMLTITNGFLSLESGDMTFYGAKMLRKATELKDLMVLLDAVEADARRAEKVKDE